MKSATALSTPKAETLVSQQTIASLPAQSHLTLITSIVNLRGLEQAWRELEKNCIFEPSVFQSYDWVRAWSETYCQGIDGPDLQILAGYESGELVFVFPLMATRRWGHRTISWLTDPFGQYGDVLCAKGQNPQAWIANSFTFMRRFKDVDLIRLRHVRKDSHIGSYSGKCMVNAKAPERAPYLDLTVFKSEADYEARYTSTQRKRRKKIRKSLEESGEVTFQRLPIGSLADAAMSLAIAEKNDWLAERGRINRVLGCPGHLAFLKTLSRIKNSAVDVIVTELTADNKPVSWEIAFRHGSTHFAYITSHMNNMTDLSPGRLHMDLSQRLCIADAMQRFDLMVPYDAHKESWSSACAETEDYFVPLSRAGWLLGHGFIKTLRPILRKVYYRLPQAVLRTINLRRRLVGALITPTKT